MERSDVGLLETPVEEPRKARKLDQLLQKFGLAGARDAKRRKWIRPLGTVF